VLRPPGVVDPVARAQIVQPVGRARMPAPRQQQGVDQPIARNQWFADPLQFGVEEGGVERRVVNDERSVARKGEEIVGDLRERRLVLEEIGGKPVHLEGRGGHVALGVDVAMEGLAGRDTVEQLDAADLHHPIAGQGIEAGGFRIEHDFTH
jgi:hypothetical protein